MVTLTQTLLIIVITVLTVIITAIGVQLYLLLRDVRKTLGHTNAILDQADELIHKLSNPAASITGIVSGLKEGANIIETISGIFSRHKSDSNNDYMPDDES